MCGIVAVIRRPSTRQTPDHGELLAAMDRVGEDLSDDDVVSAGWEALDRAASELVRVDAALRGTPGLRCLITQVSSRPSGRPWTV